MVNELGAEFWFALLSAGVCGSAIGLERQLRRKPVGIRTSAMVCMGTVIFVYLGSMLAAGSEDPTRVLGQVVTGIGFLGAGVIMSRNGAIHGVTTAAVIWMLASIGCVFGTGFIRSGFLLTAIMLLLLIGAQNLDRRVGKTARESEVGGVKSE